MLALLLQQTGKQDTQKHILECHTILSENDSSSGQYSDIFSDNVCKQVSVARSIQTNLYIKQNLKKTLIN